MNEKELIMQVEHILLLPEPEKKNRATEFLLSFQGKRTHYPYSAETKGLCKALSELYNYLGSRAQGEKEYDEAMD